MKKIILLLTVLFSIVGCGINCDSKPPKRAIMHSTGGMGMQYHFSIYIPGGEMAHSPSLKCTEYSYSKIDIYSDILGNIQGDSVIWKSINGDLAFSEYGINSADIKLYLSKEKITIEGLKNSHNGTYKIETTSPDSWGVPIS